jgi:hypothetical protein
MRFHDAGVGGVTLAFPHDSYLVSHISISPSASTHSMKRSAVVAIDVGPGGRSRQQCSPAYPSRGADTGGREKLACVDRGWHHDLCKGAYARGRERR